MTFNEPNIESSYSINTLGSTIYQTVLDYKPERVIEFGALYGYSTICIASALRELGRGKLICYDIWDKYEYKHASINETHSNVIKYGLTDYVELQEMNFYEWVLNPTDFDLMHLDISNDGDIIELVYDSLVKNKKHGVVLFEGGTVERDNVEWMIKYNKKPFSSIQQKVQYEIVNPMFPSLSKIVL